MPTRTLSKLVFRQTVPPSVLESWHVVHVAPNLGQPCVSGASWMHLWCTGTQQSHHRPSTKSWNRWVSLDLWMFPPLGGLKNRNKTWEKHERLPTSLSLAAYLVELIRFLQSQPHGAAEWASEKIRHCLQHRSSLRKFHNQINRVQFCRCGSDRWGDTSRLQHWSLTQWAAQAPRRHSLPTRRHCQKPNSLFSFGAFPGPS